MRRIALIAMLLLVVVIFTSKSTPVHAQVQEQQGVAVEATPEPKVIKVKSGDSLIKIAKKHKTSYKRIFYANKKIEDPDLIYPGQKLRIPETDEKLEKRKISAVFVQQNPVEEAEYKPTTNIDAAPKLAPNYSGGSSDWDRLARCESGGNWSINTGNGYYGGLQFSLSSWRGVGGSGYPHQASKSEQIKRARMLRGSGGWGHWPTCSAKLGLR